MNKILEVENLVFKYEKESDVNQLNGVSFSITKGEWVSIIGQNGSGKSTTARLTVFLKNLKEKSKLMENF